MLRKRRRVPSISSSILFISASPLAQSNRWSGSLLSPRNGSSGEQSEQTCDKGPLFSGSPVSAPLKTFCSSPKVLLLPASLAIGINQRKAGRRIVFLLQRNRVDGDKNLQCGGYDSLAQVSPFAVPSRRPTTMCVCNVGFP